jgi:hypothetical protein
VGCQYILKFAGYLLRCSFVKSRHFLDQYSLYANCNIPFFHPALYMLSLYLLRGGDYGL